MFEKNEFVGIDVGTSTKYLIPLQRNGSARIYRSVTNPGVVSDMYLKLLAVDTSNGNESFHIIGTAKVELFDASFTASELVFNMNTRGPEFGNIAQALVGNITNNSSSTEVIQQKYRVKTYADCPLVAVMSQVSLSEEASKLNCVRYLMENIYSILDCECGGDVEAIVYISAWDEEENMNEASNAALEAGFCEVEGNPIALYLPMSKISE